MTQVVHAWWLICRCGHTRQLHRHHIHGDDCQLCDCDKFKHGPKPTQEET